MQRIGRMAFISDEDLRVWRPMHERAPRKYQQRAAQHLQEPSESLVDFPEGAESPNLDAIDRLATHLERIYRAVAISSEALIPVIHDAFASAVRLDRAVIFLLDEDREEMVQAYRSPHLAKRFPNRLPVADYALFRHVTPESRARIVLDLPAEDPAIGAYYAPDEKLGSVLLVPLHHADQVLGVMIADRNGETFGSMEERLAIVQHLADQTALALHLAREREETQRRTRILESIIDELPSSVVATDERGLVLVSNRAHEAFVGTELRVNQSFKELAGRVDPRWHDTDRADREVGLLRVLAGEDVPVYDYRLERTGQPSRTYALAHQRIEIDGELAGAMSVATDITHSQEHVVRREEEIAELTRRLQQAEHIAIWSARLADATSIEMALDVLLRALTEGLEADSGFIALREDDGMYHGHAELRTQGWAIPEQVFDPISYPNSVLAFARRGPVFVRVGDAGLIEQRMFEALGWHGKLIVPLQRDHDHVGFAFLGYREAVSDSDLDLNLAATFGRIGTSIIALLQARDEQRGRRKRIEKIAQHVPVPVLAIDHATGIVAFANQAARDLWGAPFQGEMVRAASLPMVDVCGTVFPYDRHPLLQLAHAREPVLGRAERIRDDSGADVAVAGYHTPIVRADGSLLTVSLFVPSPAEPAIP